MKRILIAGANPYNANKGVVALASSTLFLFHKLFSENKDQVELCVYNHEFKREWDILRTPHGEIVRFKNILPTDLFSVSCIFKTLFSKSKLYYLKEFLKCDYVFNIMAGDGFSDIYGEDVMLSLLKINKLCRLFHKPYYLLPQTYGPFFSQTSFEFAKKECLSAKILLSRDRESTNFLRNEFGCTNVIDSIDLAFALPYKQLKKYSGAVHLGINISETLCSKHDGHQFLLAQDYYSVMKCVILQLLADGFTIHLIPHVANTISSPHNEYYIQYKLWEEIQHPSLIPPPFFLSACDAKSYISSMDLFIGSRMHACIAAFSSNVPVLLLGYSRKFSGLFSGTLDYPYLLDIAEDFSTESVLRVIHEMLQNLPEIKESIRDKNRTLVIPRLNSLYQSLTEILNG